MFFLTGYLLWCAAQLVTKYSSVAGDCQVVKLRPPPRRGRAHLESEAERMTSVIV